MSGMPDAPYGTEPKHYDFDPALQAELERGILSDRRVDFAHRGEKRGRYLPRGLKLKDMKRCPTCGGLVKLPCILCRTEAK